MPDANGSKERKEKKGKKKEKTNSHLPRPPPPFHNTQMINQQRRKERLSRIRKARNLPDERAPQLRIRPEMRGDLDAGHVFEIEDGEGD